MQPTLSDAERECPNCHHKSAAAAFFCAHCGHRFLTLAEDTSAQAPPPDPVRVSPKSSIASFVLVGIVVIWLISRGGQQQPISPTSTDTTSEATTKSSQRQTYSSPPSEDSTTPAKPDLEVTEAKWKQEEYVTYVAGTIRNNTDHSYNYAQVEINILNKDGSVADSTFANVNNLEPGQKWKFKAGVMSPKEGMTFKIKNVTGF